MEGNIKLIATGLIETAKDQAGGQLTIEMIKDAVKKAMELVPGSVEHVNPEALIAQFERDYHTYVGEVLTLKSDDDGWEPWLAKAKAEISWDYWERYRTYLLRY